MDSTQNSLVAATDPAALLSLTTQIGKEVVAPAAETVDRDARFPVEAFDAMRSAGLLGALVPTEHGGAGFGIGDIAAVCETLGRYCSSTAMIYAMHQIQVACIVHHGLTSPRFREYIEQLCRQQRLIASATSEIGVGGDLRTSVCAVETRGDRFTLCKQAPVISYGAEAQDILLTARRAPDAPASDQVLVLATDGEYTLEQFSEWDTFGFRGTCSPGFTVTAEGPAENVLPVPFAEIASRTMLPVSHILWSSLWLGIATNAVDRARTFVRAQARKNPESTSPAGTRLAEVFSVLQEMRSNVHAATHEYEELLADPESLDGFGFAIRMNNLKISASRQVVDIVAQALLTIGIQGYRNGTEFSLGRHIRDAHGAALMINNDRVLRANARMLLVSKEP